MKQTEPNAPRFILCNAAQYHVMNLPGLQAIKQLKTKTMAGNQSVDNEDLGARKVILIIFNLINLVSIGFDKK